MLKRWERRQLCKERFVLSWAKSWRIFVWLDERTNSFTDIHLRSQLCTPAYIKTNCYILTNLQLYFEKKPNLHWRSLNCTLEQELNKEISSHIFRSWLWSATNRRYLMHCFLYADYFKIQMQILTWNGKYNPSLTFWRVRKCLAFLHESFL